jgi:amino acid adenylation domain-containing protein
MVNRISEVLNQLSDLNIYLFVENEKLKTRSVKGALTAEIILLIKENKEGLITYLVEQELALDQQPSIEALGGTSAPLSFAQQRLWMIDEIDGGSPQFNMSNCLRLTGDINLNALEFSFYKIINRHQILRTNIAIVDEPQAVAGDVKQVVCETADFHIEVIDLTHLAGQGLEQEVLHQTNKEADKTFDLSHDKLLRAKLLKIKEQEHILIICIHHIVSDGWSTSILINEFCELYTSFIEDVDAELPNIEVQYGDYAAWQRKYLQGEVLDKKLSYWEKQLSGIPAVHGLPLDGIRPKRQSYNGANLIVSLPISETVKFNGLCQKNGATLFMGLQSLFASLLHRYSNETDVVMGTPVANRDQEEVANLIGFFVNTLTLRSDLSSNPSFVELLGKNKNMLLSAYEHQQVPFEYIVDRINPMRSLSHSPLFQVMIVLQNNERSSLSLPGLELDDAEIKGVTTNVQYDLILEINESEEGLFLNWEYNTDLFYATTIERLSDSYIRLFKGVLNTPEKALSNIDLLSPWARNDVLKAGVGRAVDFPKAKCIHELFEAQVASQPDTTALIFENAVGNRQSLSYQELNSRANQLAHYLRDHKNLTPNTMVGLCLRRSPELIIAMLAILKAGAAYVPLDAEYPEARLQFIIEDAGLELVLSESSVVATSDSVRAHALCLDDDILKAALTNASQGNIDVTALGLSSDHLSYVIYTSGSTGKPKGTLLSHSGLTNLTSNQAESFELKKGSRVLQFASIAFDAATWELVMALPNGATLCVFDNQIFKSPQLLSAYVETHQITHATLPPAILSVLDRKCWDSVTTLIVAGESCSLSIADQWRQGRRFINAYGPSEATVCATMGEYFGEKLHIGKALNNVSTYVLNDQQLPVPVNCIGELYIGGAGLAKGYLNRPNLNDEKFIINPFIEAGYDSSARLYRTGDLVRYLSTGDLEFVGRVDHQVKIRGFRVELGEVENLLNIQQQVNQSLITANAPGNGSGEEMRLVAYIVPSAHASASLAVGASNSELSEEQTNARLLYVESLRQALRNDLPEYMLPSSFILLANFPLTANGKIDFRALPTPQKSQLQTGYVAPSTETEKGLCDIWQHVLGLERIGTKDNFFDLGGNSLLAMRLVTEVNFKFHISLPIKDIFEYQSIDLLSEYVDVLQNAEPSSETLRISKASRQEVLLTSYSQQRLWMLEKIDGRNSHYNLHEGIKLVGSLNYNALEKALKTIVERHESLRTIFATQENGEPYQVIQAPDVFTVELEDLSGISTDARDAEVSRQIRKETATNFDLSSDMMLRSRVLKLGEQEHVLLVTVNHIASDGWSMSVLVNEFCTLYKAYSEGRDNPLEPLEFQYADYAQWQRESLSNDVLNEQLGYWDKQLAGISIVHALPLDTPRGQQQSFDGDVVQSTIDRQTTEELIKLCQSHSATVFMGLQALFSALLSRLSNTNDVVMGTSIANREQGEVSNLIGFFVNSLVLRNDLSEDPNFIELLSQSKRMLLSAYANQQVPFEQVVERLQPERNLSHSPLFQIILVLQNNVKDELALPGIEISATDQESNGAVAKYELALDVNQSEEGLALNWEYNCSLFSRDSIQRMARNFTQLVKSAVALPELAISRINILSEEERYLVSKDWCQNVVDYPETKCVHELFESQVEIRPNEIAIAFEDIDGSAHCQLSYAQLNARSNQLAHFLVHEYEVCPDYIIGVCFERSADMIVAMLAILKSGAAYLPIDPDYPDDRIEFMLQDAGLTVVLTQQHLQNMAPLSSVTTLCIDGNMHAEKFASWPTSNISTSGRGLESRHLAYVIYTSGSTGKPKGTLLVHSGLSNLALGQIKGFGVTPESRVLQFASISFDAATSEWAMALLSGASLYVIGNEIYKSPQALSRTIKRNSISHATLPPALLPVLEQGDWTSVSTLIVAGEACSQTLVDKWSLGRTFINAYGPSESTVCASVGYYDKAKGFLDIGRPLQNVSVYVLNQSMMPMPINSIGELYIGGVGLARGYLNRTELTAEKFVQNPFYEDGDEEVGKRLYRTGDLVRWNVHGCLDFIGRIDHQVQIRGFRVELGEIESTLLDSSRISEALVLAEGEAGDKRLLAYLVPSKGYLSLVSSQNDSLDDVPDVADASALTRREFIEDLSKALNASLPAYMVPSGFVILDSFPLTSNGKIDRQLLPRDQIERVLAPYVAPRNETEEILSKIWQEVLGVERVGVKDDFFELGGHSLLIVKLLNAVKHGFNMDIPIKVVFQFSDLESVASYIEVFRHDKNMQRSEKSEAEVETFKI